jgi:hypothetical protein
LETKWIIQYVECFLIGNSYKDIKPTQNVNGLLDSKQITLKSPYLVLVEYISVSCEASDVHNLLQVKLGKAIPIQAGQTLRFPEV